MKSYKINENTELQQYENYVSLYEKIKGGLHWTTIFEPKDLLPLTKALIKNMDKRDLLNLNEAIQEIILDEYK
jgi:hypothetical protein